MRISTFFIILAVLTLPIAADCWLAMSNGMLMYSPEQLPLNLEGRHSQRFISISLSQKNLTLVRGSRASLDVSVKVTSLRSSRVSLFARGVPTATNVTFSPSSGRASFSSIMTISCSDVAPLGESNVTITAVAGNLEKSVTLFLQVLPVTYNLTVLSATVPPNATVDSVVSVSTNVANYGSRSETFRVDLYANGTLVAETSTIKLTPHANYTASLTWNTTRFAIGGYNLIVSIPPVPKEINLGKSILQAGRILLEPISRSKPNSPPPVPEKPTSASSYGRVIAIVAAIAELAVVLFLFVRGGPRRPSRPGQTTGRR